jgi:hypothetical protein
MLGERHKPFDYIGPYKNQLSSPGIDARLLGRPTGSLVAVKTEPENVM